MTHHHHDGLHCSCCSPISKALISKLDISIPQTPSNTSPPSSQNLLIKKGTGTIQTLQNGENTEVEALAVSDQKILAAGNLADVKQALQQTHPDYEEITLTGNQTVLPSLIEPHLHILPTALFNTWTSLSRFKPQKFTNQQGETVEIAGQILIDTYTCQEQLERLYKANSYSKCDTDKNIENWYIGADIDPSLFTGDESKTLNNEVIGSFVAKDGTQPFKEDPVFILNASMHIAYINSAAIQLFLSDADPSIDGVSILKNLLNTDPHNGQLMEMEQILPFTSILPMPSQTSFKNQLIENIDVASSRGVTFMFDAGTLPSDSTKAHTPNQPEILFQLAKNQSTPVRIGAALVVEGDETMFEKEVIGNGYLPITDNTLSDTDDNYVKGNRYSFFSMPYIKVISDGSNQGLTGYLSNPYMCDDNYTKLNSQPIKGNLNYSCCSNPSSDELNKLVSAISKSKWPMMIHANGDEAIEITLNAFKSVPNENQGDKNRIEHASLLTDEYIQTMSELNISPSFLIGHVGYWGDAFLTTIFGEERSNLLDRCKSALNSNLKISLHSDNSVTPLGPLRMMDQAIHRVMEASPEKDILNQNEQLTRLQALKAVTIDAAVHCCVEDLVGSLEVGKYADFVILENNPLTMPYLQDRPYETFRNINVISTWKGGAKYYPLPKRSDQLEPTIPFSEKEERIVEPA